MKSEIHSVLDLETLSLERNAVILSMGCVVFDINKGESIDIYDAFYNTCKYGYETDQKIGHISEDTKLWWGKQNKITWNEANRQENQLPDSIVRLFYFLTKHSVKYLWSHGKEFDIEIIKWWAAKLKIKFLPKCFEFRNTRDTRTLFHTAGRTLTMSSHNALDDAEAEAKLIYDCWKQLTRKEINCDEYLWNSIPKEPRVGLVVRISDYAELRIPEYWIFVGNRWAPRCEYV